MPPGELPKLKQVEFNTISVSFGALTERVSALHRYVVDVLSRSFLASNNLPAIFMHRLRITIPHDTCALKISLPTTLYLVSLKG